MEPSETESSYSDSYSDDASSPLEPNLSFKVLHTGYSTANVSMDRLKKIALLSTSTSENRDIFALLQYNYSLKCLHYKIHTDFQSSITSDPSTNTITVPLGLSDLKDAALTDTHIIYLTLDNSLLARSFGDPGTPIKYTPPVDSFTGLMSLGGDRFALTGPGYILPLNTCVFCVPANSTHSSAREPQPVPQEHQVIMLPKHVQAQATSHTGSVVVASLTGGEAVAELIPNDVEEAASPPMLLSRRAEHLYSVHTHAPAPGASPVVLVTARDTTGHISCFSASHRSSSAVPLPLGPATAAVQSSGCAALVGRGGPDSHGRLCLVYPGPTLTGRSFRDCYDGVPLGSCVVRDEQHAWYVRVTPSNPALVASRVSHSLDCSVAPLLPTPLTLAGSPPGYPTSCANRCRRTTITAPRPAPAPVPAPAPAPAPAPLSGAHTIHSPYLGAPKTQPNSLPVHIINGEPMVSLSLLLSKPELIIQLHSMSINQLKKAQTQPTLTYQPVKQQQVSQDTQMQAPTDQETSAPLPAPPGQGQSQGQGQGGAVSTPRATPLGSVQSLQDTQMQPAAAPVLGHTGHMAGLQHQHQRDSQPDYGNCPFTSFGAGANAKLFQNTLTVVKRRRFPRPPSPSSPAVQEMVTVPQKKRPRQRLVWTRELHLRFLAAVLSLGVRSAVPRGILRLMNVQGLTRENVASHLQKFRLQLRKQYGLTPSTELQDRHLPENIPPELLPLAKRWEVKTTPVQPPSTGLGAVVGGAVAVSRPALDPSAQSIHPHIRHPEFEAMGPYCALPPPV
eukprot:gnl/Dysnectes_brevis/295_a328_1909.p1 GENE.gnl/Dysnectes_brevis/295_a328_1909~~gnl/Dysnectes_brevis/295_a328_1909.p1  ORF type:complete len:787 (+),score=217.93 gnl/Dysnectes_brevis/295_a328_1909:45-2405(+)